MGSILESVDSGQRRVSALGFPIAVLYKFWDDQGNYLAAIITYYAFVAIFPLLLLATSIFGFVLQGNQELQERALNSALSTIPVLGTELGQSDGLQGSVAGVVVGALVALYGALGLGQAIQNALNIAWSVPRNSRPNLLLVRLRSLLLLVTAGSAVLVVSVVSTLGSSTSVFGFLDGLGWVVRLVTFLLIGSVLTLLFRLGAARAHSLRRAVPGAFVTAGLWQFLQYLGTIYVTRVIAETSSVGQVLGVVLGLVGVIWLAATMAVLGIEVNVVLARTLWPRALMTLFTDNVDPTDADRRAYASYAQRERHKGYEQISVRFDERSGRTHEFAMPVIAQERRAERNGEPVREGPVDVVRETPVETPETVGTVET